MPNNRKRLAEADLTDPGDTVSTGYDTEDDSESCGSHEAIRIKNPLMPIGHSVRKELADMIILHKYPLSIVNHKGFEKFSRSLNPNFKLVSRRQVREDILKSFNDERSIKQSVLQNNVGRIAVSFDLWTSHDEKRQFVAATAHFIDKSWSLQNFFIRFPRLCFESTEKSHMETYLECLNSWGLDLNLSTLTFDDFFDDKFLKETYSTRLDCERLILGGKFLRMRCFTLTLKALVGEAFDTLGDALMKIQDSVDYWTVSSSRNMKIGILSRQLGVPCGKDLIPYCETKWDSIYLMLERAWLFRDAFKDEKLSDSGYTCIPSEDDWKLTKEICEVLKLFYETAMFFFGKVYDGKKYHTANKYFEKVCDIKLALSRWVTSENEVVKGMASNMIENFDEYWTEVNTVLAITAILDPRYKMHIVEYYFTKIYNDEAQGEIDRVGKVFSELFQEYHTRVRPGKTSNQIKPSSSRHDNPDSMSEFDLFVIKRKKESVTTELDYYFDEDVLPRNDDFNVLLWWQHNGVKYPTLQMIARDVLAIPVSKVSSKDAFSIVGNVLEKNCNKLCENLIEPIMCKRNWLTASYYSGGSDYGVPVLEEEEEDW